MVSPNKGWLKRCEVRYGLAVAAVAAGLALCVALTAWVGEGFPAYLTFYPAVAAAALLGGLGPGLLATALTVAAVDYWIASPQEVFYHGTPDEIAEVVLFSLMGVFISGLAQFYRRAREKRAASENELALPGSSEALRRTAEQHRLALQAGKLGTWNYNLLTGEVFWDERCRALFGATRKDRIRYEQFLGLVHEADREGTDRAVKAALAPGSTGLYEREFRVVWPDGSTHWVAARGQVYFENEGGRRKPRRFIGTVCDVTETRLAEEALRQSREDLNHAQAVANVGSWRLNVQRDESLWSDENCRIFGIPQGTRVTYEMFLATVHPEDREYVDRKWKARLRGEPYDIEHRIVVGERVKWVRARGELELDAHGILLGVFGTTQDITERKEAEEALRQTEGRYRDLVQNANSAIIRWKRDGTLTFFNEYAQHFFGYSAAEIIGKKVGVLIPQQGSAGVHPGGLIEEIVAHPDRYVNNVNENVCRDGRHVWMTWTNRPILDERGQVVEILAIGSDITARRQAEEALAKQREELQVILDSSPILIFYKDRENRFLRVNRAFAETMGLPREQLEGRSLFDLYPWEQADGYWKDDKEVMASGRSKLNIVEPMQSPTGERWFQTDKVPFRDAQGDIIGIIGFALDITERKRAEEALGESEARLRLAQDSAGAGVWDWDLAAGRLEWSAELFRLFGLDAGGTEATFDAWRRLVHADDRRVADEEIATAIKNGTALSSEYRIVLPTGAVRWIHALGSATYASSGQPRRMTGICIDITARKLAEAAVQSSYQTLETVVNYLPAAVALIRGSDLRLQLVNPAYQAIAPGTPMVGKTLDELWSEAGHDFTTLCCQVLETGEAHQVEDELNTIRRWPDGGPEPAYFSWSLHRVRLPGNDGWGILNCAWETTARKQAEEAVRQSEERLRFALETSHTGAWDLDLVDHTAFRSLEHDRIFGYSELLPEWTYENFLEHILPEDRAAVDAKFQEATARQTDWSFECRIRRADGETRWIWAAGRHRADPASGRRRMAGIVQDITERKAAEASLGKPGDFVPAQGRAGPHARPE